MSWNDESEYDLDRDDTMPCPHCRAEIYDESEQCPYCGQYITAQTSPFQSAPTWMRVLFVLIILAIVLSLALSIYI